jgi:hypothetical protein
MVTGAAREVLLVTGAAAREGLVPAPGDPDEQPAANTATPTAAASRSAGGT